MRSPRRRSRSPGRSAQMAPWNRAPRARLSWPLDNIGAVAAEPGRRRSPAISSSCGSSPACACSTCACRTRSPPPIPGPQFGVAGTRRLTGVSGRPLIGTIIKPSVGLGPAETAALVADAVRGRHRLHQGRRAAGRTAPHCPFDARVRAVMRVDRTTHADRTGKKVMFAFNLTGEIDEMRRRHDLVLAHGGTCVMASLNSVGLVGMVELGRHTQLPIHAHRNGWGALTRHPALGWSTTSPWQKLWRLAGADHMHVNGLGNKFSETDDSVIASARSALTPMFAHKPCIAMPVFSSGQTPARPRHLARTRFDRSDLRRRRRHHRPPAGWPRASPALRRMGRGDRRHAARAPRMATALAAAWSSGDDIHRCPTVHSSPSTATTSPARPRRWRRSTFAGVPTVLFLEPPTPERLAFFRAVPRHRHRRHGARAGPGLDGRKTCRRLSRARSARRADRALQGVLDLRFVAADRLDRARDRSRACRMLGGAWHPLIVADRRR